MPDRFTNGELEVMRGDLANVFYETTRQNASYIFDNSIAGLRQSDDGVEVSFCKGEIKRFDLVIGPDGLHSNVRSLAFGNEAKYLNHLDIYCAIFTVPNFLRLKEMAGLYYGTRGKRVGIFSADHDKEARVSLYFASSRIDYDYHDLDHQKDMILQQFSDLKWHVPQLLKFMENAPDFYFDSVSQVKMDSWARGRITLLGDAGYCASPMSGMGTSMAVIGSYIWLVS
ncbi:MAG: FAD-dependent monooxygenase [Ginsengibacter sp.]